ncbi:MAG: hypothetical protein ACKV0T_31055 [Planctomycetales bacterium]
MSCARFEREWQQWVDAERTGDSSWMLVHAQDCPRCRAIWDGGELLADVLLSWRDQVPDVDLVGAVVEAHLGRPTAPWRGRPTLEPARVALASVPQGGRSVWRGWMSPTVAAIAMFAAVGAALWMSHPAPNEPAANLSPPTSERGADVADLPRQSDSAPPPLRTLPMETPDAGKAYAALAQQAAGALQEWRMTIDPSGSSRPKRRSPSARDQLLEGLESRLKPMGRGLENAFDFLWQVGQTAD